MLYSFLAFAPAAIADEVRIDYINDDGQAQELVVDASSSDADNELAATLILEGSKITVILDEKEDLEIIADSVSEKAPDQATATAVRNTILGVGASLGGRSIERTAQDPETDTLQVDTPPLTPPAAPMAPPTPSASPPPPSSSLPPPHKPVASPN